MKKIYKRLLPLGLSLFFTAAFTTMTLGQFGCGNGVVLSDGFTQMGITTPGDGGPEDWNVNPTGTSIFEDYWDDDVYLFEYTAGATFEEISMSIFTRNNWNGIGIFENCNVDSFSDELDASGSSSSSDVTQTVEAFLSPGQTVYIAVGQWGTPDDLDFDVTDFTVTQIPCPDPSDLTEDAVGGSEAIISWTENGLATEWNIEWGTSGFTPGTSSELGAISNTTNNPETITGLTPLTDYDIYVQSDCGGGDQSAWIGPLSVTTTVACPDPSALSEVITSATSSEISWTENGTSTDWILEWGTVGFTPGTSTEEGSVATSTNPETITGLTPETTYEVYVQSDCGGGNGQSAWVGPLEITTADACSDPVNLNVDVLNSSEADFSWDEFGTSTAWSIEWGAPGFTPGTTDELGSDLGNTTQTTNITGLSEATTYEVYVQADCGSGDFSGWSGPISFTTPYTEQVPVSTFPWDEDFETGGTEWTLVNGSEVNQWAVGTAINNGGSSSLYVSDDEGTSHNYDNGTSSTSFAYRDITMPAAGTYVDATLTFDWLCDGESSGFSPYDFLSVWAVPTSLVPTLGTELSESGSAPTGVVDLTGILGEETAFQTNTFQIPAAYAGETFRLVFQWENDGSAGQNPPAAVDNVNISIFNCLAPSGLVASNVDTDEATVSWDDNTSGAASFIVEYGPDGFTPGTGTTVTAADTFEVLTGLIQDQDYDYYVYAECGDGTFSQQSAVGTFSTLVACDPISGLSLVEVTPTTVELTWNAPVGYADFIIEYGPAGFTLGSGTTMAAPPTVITGLDDDTEYDFYVFSDCGAGVTSQPEEITVTTPPICPTPSDLVFSEIGADSVVVEWTVNGTETDWVIEYGESGFVQGTGTIVNTTDNPDTLTGLNGETEYDVYVWANCGSGDLSDTISGSFTTQPTCLAPSDLVFSEIGADSVVVEWTENGLATDWVIEYDTAGFTPGTGTIVNTTDNPDTLTGLNPEWTYDVYVWSDCGSGDVSDTIFGSFTTQPTCLPVSDILISDIGADTAVVSWTVNGTETSWNIEYGETGFSLGNGTVLTGVDNPETLTGLDGVTTYEVYVTANCGSGDLADTVGPIEFTTEGSCGIYELLLEDSYGDGWNGGELDVYVNGVLEYPGLTLTSGYGPEVFEIPLNINDVVSIEYSSTSIYDYENSYELFDEQGNSLLLEGAGTDVPGNLGDYNIPTGIQACPTCPALSDLVVDTVGLDMAEISWTSNGSETSWNIEYDTTGFTLDNGTFIDGTTDNPYTLTGLESGATYDVYVQASCSSSDSSVWVPLTFQTPYSCEDTLYDVGGPNGDYIAGMEEIVTARPSSANQYVRVTFEEFEYETSYDGVYVYDGEDINAPSIPSGNAAGFGPMTEPGAYWGTDVPGPFSGEVLTFEFLSDGSGQNPGHKAFVDCFDCNPTPGVDGIEDVCQLDDTLDLNTIVTLPTHPDTTKVGSWSFPVNPGVLVDDSLLIVTSLAAGTYEAVYILNTPCGGDTTIATINVYGPSNAGSNGTLTVCKSQPINLFDGLNGNVDLGGTWYDPSDNPITGSQPVSSSIEGSFNYDYVTSNGVCPADTALVEVIVASDEDCGLSLGEEKLNELTVYPNPATDVINIANPSNSESLRVEILDMNGRLVLSDAKALANAAEGTIDVSHLVKGMYTLRVYNEEGHKTFKVVIQ